MEPSTIEDSAQGFNIKSLNKALILNQNQNLIAQNFQPTITNDPKQCRICLQNENQNSKQFVAPCDCIGSVRYIHKMCFVEWMKKKFQDPNLQQEMQDGRDKIKCEICRQHFDYGFEEKLKMKDCEDIQNSFKKRKCLAFLFLMFFLVILALISYITVYAKKDSQLKSYNPRKPKFFLVFIVLGLAIIGLLFGIKEFLTTFFLKKCQKFFVKDKLNKKLEIRSITKSNQKKVASVHPEQ